MPVDISLLCDFAEYLCATIIIHNRYRHTGNLHEITIPRSWLLKWLNLDHAEKSSINFFAMLKDPLALLLKQAYVGAGSYLIFITESEQFKVEVDYLLYGGRRNQSPGTVIRSVFIARM